MADPTPFHDLDAVLREFVESARTVLGGNLCGAYLQGSFAVGGADIHSDVDFVVVTHEQVGDALLPDLQAMHKRIHAIDVRWAQHLEGSYIPRESLRHVDPSRSPFLYLDNGASELIWDDHCNRAVVRWSLREHGVVLSGPDPKLLVDPVSGAQLRAEALEAMPEYAAWAAEPAKAGPMSRWKQPYLVLTFCRMLHMVRSGTVVSKQAAAEWALGALAAEWATLIRGALEDRPDPWLRVHQPAEPRAVARTLAFIDYALEAAAP